MWFTIKIYEISGVPETIAKAAMKIVLSSSIAAVFFAAFVVAGNLFWFMEGRIHVSTS